MTRFPKVVIPAAGLGIRLKPFSEFLPKELLPLPDGKPLIYHALEEVRQAGLREICVVIRKEKEIIRSYLKSTPLYSALKFVYQKKPLGIGDAISHAAFWVKASPFLLIFPDQFVLGKRNASEIFLETHKENKRAVLELAAEVEKSHRSHFTGHPHPSGHEGLFMVGRILFPAGAVEYFHAGSAKRDTFYSSFEKLLKKTPNQIITISGRAYDAGTLSGYQQLWQSLSFKF